MRDKIRFEESIYLPSTLADEISGLGLTPLNLGRTCRFLKLLMVKSIKDNKSDIFCYTDMPYNYLAKIFGKNYKKDFLNSLLESGIIQTNGRYSKERKIVLQYKINPSKWRRIVDSGIYDKDSKLVVNNSGRCIMSPLTDTQVLTEVVFDLQKGLKPRENSDNIYLENIGKVHINSEGLLEDAHLKSGGIELKMFTTEGGSLEEAIPLYTKSGIKYINKKKAIARSVKQDKILVRDGRVYKIVNPSKFLERKRISKFCSDVNSIMELKRGNYRSSRNETNFRLDTNLTNMSSYLVDRIVRDNNLVEIDLCNSQLAISTLLIELDTEDFNLYKELSLGCGIYEFIQDRLELSSRDEAKSLMLNVLFSSHKSRDERVTKLKKVFPTVINWINTYKKNVGDNQFAILLQKKESEISIDNLYERLNNKGIFVLTKHDSFIVRREDENQVRDIITTYFKEIGLNIMLR